MKYFQRCFFFIVTILCLAAMAFPQTLLEKIGQSPTSANLRDDLALAYVEQGNYSEAIREFSTSLSLDPSDNYARYFLGLLFERRGDYDKALQYYVQALKWNSYSLNFRLGHCYHRLGLEKEALICFQKVKMFRDRADVHYAMAFSQAGLGHYKKGLAELATAETLDPNFIVGKEYLSSFSRLREIEQTWKKMSNEWLLKFLFVIFLILGVVLYFGMMIQSRGGKFYDKIKVSFQRIYPG